MALKYKALFKYEFKKLLWFIFALFIFIVLYSSMVSRGTAQEVNNILTQGNNLNVYFKILTPHFYFIYSFIVFILVYIQFNDGFNMLWHSLPFTNRDIVAVKLITGVITLFVFLFVLHCIMLNNYLRYEDIYIDLLQTLDMDTNILNIVFIFKSFLNIFFVYVFIYLFTVLIQYFTGNCFSGICLSFLLIHMPLLILNAFRAYDLMPWNLKFLICPHYFCREVITGYYTVLFTNLGINLDLSGVYKIRFISIVYYVILSAAVFAALIKTASSSQWIEQSSPFSEKAAAAIFKIVFTIDFFAAGTLLFHITVSKLLIGTVFGIIGYIISNSIVKRQGVEQ